MERNENLCIGNNVVYIFDINFELDILIINSRYQHLLCSCPETSISIEWKPFLDGK